MTVADWALVISIGSVAISLAGFVWNVWSKFIFPKPRIRVGFSFVQMMAPSSEKEGFLTHTENSALALSATNLGPGATTLYNALAIERRKHWWNRKPSRYGLLNPLPHFPEYPGQFQNTSGPFGGGLPKKVEIGEQFTVYFVPDHEALASGRVDRIGFTDTFGQLHWAPRRDLIEARKHIREACDKVGKKYPD
jgi:hypothetical protein